MNGQSAVGQVVEALKTPFSTAMTWTQLAAVTVFVLVVMLAWRQVTLFIGQEI
jgi:hypothetical protein